MHSAPPFLAIDWEHVFRPDVSLLEIFVRGSVIYLTLFVVLRAIFKREASGLGITDLLVVVLIADAVQNGMSADYTSVPDGLALAGTILFWSYLLDWISYRSDRLRRLVTPPPLPLVRDGKPLYRNMRRELISLDELRSQARLQGVQDIEHIVTAHMESDGRISIVSDQDAGADRRHRSPSQTDVSR